MKKLAYLAVSGCAVGVAFGQQAPEPTEPAEQVPPPLEVETEEDRWSLDLSLRYTSDYFFRGIVQRSDAVNLQPGAEVGFDLLNQENWSLNVFGGVWSNFTDDTVPDEGDDEFRERWYELDVYAGITLDFADRWSATAVYTWYESPASNFEDVQDVTLSLAFDDAGLWGEDGGDFGLFPYVLFAIETSDAADGGDEGSYFEVGMAPAVAVYEGDAGGLTLAAPIAAGFSISDYYEDEDGDDEEFGFATFGLQAVYALPEGDVGQWTFTAGVDYLLLGDATESYNAGDDDEWIAYAEVGWSF